MLLTTIAELRASLRDARCAARTIGLVPTMGALHAGHLALIEQARCRSHCVVVTIFVFGRVPPFLTRYAERGRDGRGRQGVHRRCAAGPLSLRGAGCGRTRAVSPACC